MLSSNFSFIAFINGLVFVVDSTDSARFQQAAQELHTTRSAAHVCSLPILILANKQDLPSAKSPEEIAATIFEYHPLEGDGMWCVQGCAAVDGRGIRNGFEWLAWAISQRTTL